MWFCCLRLLFKKKSGSVSRVLCRTYLPRLVSRKTFSDCANLLRIFCCNGEANRCGSGHLTWPTVASWLEQPTRWQSDNINRSRSGRAPAFWSCRRWGLPCRHRHRHRGALLPHHFTIACPPINRGHRLCIFCGTFPRVAPGGR